MKEHKNSIYTYFERYLGEFVYGGMDGCITTFAVVAGAAGAGLNSSVVIILGFAMSIGAYLSGKTEQEHLKNQRKEYQSKRDPEKEHRALAHILKDSGIEENRAFDSADYLIVHRKSISSILLQEEMILVNEEKSPIINGGVTFFSFIIIGLIPLLVYVIDLNRKIEGNLFYYASVLTFIGFLIIRLLKSNVNKRNPVRGVIETILLGAIAASVAYFIGDFLEKLIAG